MDQVEIDRTNSMRVIFFRIALAFIFIRLSFLHEVIAERWGQNTYLLMLLGVPTLIGVFTTGAFRRVLAHKQAKLMLGFAFWILLTVPLSSWRGGSTTLFISYARTELAMLFVLGGLAITWKECRSIMAVIAAAGMVNLVTSNLFTSEGDYRMALSFGSLAGSNEFALHLLFVAVFLLYMTVSSLTSKAIRAICLGALVFASLLIVQTGSRGGALAMVVTVLFYLYWAPARQKAMAMMLVPIAFIGIVATANQQSLTRIKSIFASEEADEGTSSSEKTRRYLLDKSIEFTLSHPLFGVGPGEFGDFEGSSMREEGKRGVWLQTHNTYTQISSECGIPALILYLACLVSIYRLLMNTYKAARRAGAQEMALSVFCVVLALIAYASASTFLSLAYSYYIPIICGLAVVLSTAIQRELKAASLQPAPIPAQVPLNWAAPVAVPLTPPSAPAHRTLQTRGRRLSAALRMKN